jgi:integrase
VHYHSLRHGHATALLIAGVHPKVAQERLGHHSVAFTLDRYSHTIERLHDDAAAKIDGIFSRK